MMSLLKSLKGSWYLGKGSRAFNFGRYDQALTYFFSALKYAQETENIAEVALRKEAIAETYLKMGDYDKAILYASESLAIYKKFFDKDNSDVFNKAINRVNGILEKGAAKLKG